MIKHNIKNIFIAIASISVVIATIIIVHAYLSNSGENVQNTLTPADVSCLVNETFENNQKKSVQVQNTSNVGAYIRLTVVTYWQDSKGNIIESASANLGLDEIYDKNYWIAGADNTFYYKTPIESTALTADLLSGNNTITLDRRVETLDGNEFVYNQVVEFIAEAIQASPTQAVQDSWNVTVDGNGIITAVN